MEFHLMATPTGRKHNQPKAKKKPKERKKKTKKAKASKTNKRRIVQGGLCSPR
jgi:hypothetical protein